MNQDEVATFLPILDESGAFEGGLHSAVSDKHGCKRIKRENQTLTAPLRETPSGFSPSPKVNLAFPVPIRFPRVETGTIHFPAPGALLGAVAA